MRFHTKVHKSGLGIERVATGFRNPNGFFVGSNGVITAADQQGAGFHLPASILSNQEGSRFHAHAPERRQLRLTTASSSDSAQGGYSCGGQVRVEGALGTTERTSICPTVAVKCFTYFEKR